jgi:hypothetical protein
METVRKNEEALLQIAKRLRLSAKYVTKNSDNLVKEVTMRVVTTLVAATPVDTGRARANWQTSLSFPKHEILYWPPPEAPSSPEEGAQRAIDEAQMIVDAFSGGRRSIRIVNNCPYIRPLNTGTSTQAPAGFIEAAFAMGVATIQERKPLLAEVEL